MNSKRLLKLADFLETKVPNKGFNLGSWKTVSECGTVACACGWGCSIPSFKKAGLKLESIYDWPQYFMIRYKIWQDFAAVSKFFDISIEEVEFLFLDENYPKSHRSKNYVAKRIRSFVKRGGVPQWK